MIPVIDIKNLDSYIESQDLLIVGSPEKVGFSTYIYSYIAQKIFFEKNYSIIYLSNSIRGVVDAKFGITKAFQYYSSGLHTRGNILYMDSSEPSGVYLQNYNDLNFNTIVDEYDLIIVDKDNTGLHLHENVDKLYNNSKRLIINCYDLTQSLFYSIVCNKVILKSKYSKENQKKVDPYSGIINQARIAEGSFQDYINTINDF